MAHNIKLTSYVVTNTGLVRQNNEDNFYINGRFLKEEERESPLQLAIEENRKEHLFAVCDGMGGESLGEFASLTVTKALQELQDKLFHSGINSVDDKSACIKEFAADTNDKLCKSMKELGKGRIGTTLAGLYIKDNTAVAFHLGDSRVYMYRNGNLKQITEDHTEAQALVSLGIITKEQASRHQNRHQLSRHFGILPEEGLVEPDICQELEVREGDIFLLCSDGLTEMISDSRIESIIDKYKGTDDIHFRLIHEALSNGGNDNITAIVVEIEKVEQISNLVRKKRSKKPEKVFKALTGILIAAALFIAFLLCKDIYTALVENKKDNTNAVSVVNTEKGEADTAENNNGNDENTSGNEADSDNNSNGEAAHEADKKDVPAESKSENTSDKDKSTSEETTEKQENIIPEKYTLKRGESLYQISKRFYNSNNAVKLIMQINNIEDVNKVFAGQTIKLPTMEQVNNYKEPVKSSNSSTEVETTPASEGIPNEYTIKAGDNLFQISKRFYGNGSMVNAIVELNGLQSAESIKVGQIIKLPK